MKKILFAVSAVALALSAGSAMAADLPYRKEAAGLRSPAAPADVDRLLRRSERRLWLGNDAPTPQLSVLPVFDNVLTSLVMVMGPAPCRIYGASE